MSWQNASQQLQQLLTDDVHSLWILPLQCLKFNNEVVELSGPDRYFCSWISNNYLGAIKTVLKELGKENAEVIFTVSDDKVKPSISTERNKQLRLPSFPKVRSSVRHLNPRYVFDEFIVGDSNAVAHSACQALANGDKSFGQCLYINAGTGLGKSHLTHAVAHHLINYAPGISLNYINSKQLTAEMVLSIKSHTMERFKEKYNNCDVLLMEDIPALTGKTKTQEEVAAFLDILLETGKTVILTGSKTPREIEGLDGSVRSRISSGLVTTISAPDLDTRAKIISKKAANQNLMLSEEIVYLLAEHLQGDIRRIKSAIIGIKAKASLRNMAPNKEMVKEVLVDIVDRQHSLTPEVIRDFVAQQFKISLLEIQSKSRKKSLAFPRQISMYLSRKFTEGALSDIGKSLNRDHSTVVHSVRKITEAIARDNSVRGQINLLEDKIQKRYL